MRNVWCIEHGIVCLRFVIHIKYTACWLCNQWIPLGSMKLCAFLMYVFRFVKIPNAHEFVHHRFESTHWIQNLFALYRNPSIHIESRNCMRVCMCLRAAIQISLIGFFFRSFYKAIGCCCVKRAIHALNCRLDDFFQLWESKQYYYCLWHRSSEMLIVKRSTTLNALKRISCKPDFSEHSTKWFSYI